MPFQLFHDLFPELAESETRSITLLGHTSEPALPAGEYAFCEMFCNEAGCDCRRVMFHVISRFRAEPVAVVAWGWESPEFYAAWLHDDDPDSMAELIGPTLNLGSPQSELAGGILGLVRDVLLKDKAYVERVKRHYRQFRDKIDGSNGHAGFRQDDEGEETLAKARGDLDKKVPNMARKRFPASVPRKMYWSDSVGGCTSCPDCHTVLTSEAHSYVMITRGPNGVGGQLVGNDAGHFCSHCPVVVLDRDEFSRFASIAMREARDGQYAVIGIVDLDAVPVHKRHLPFDDETNPVPLVEFTNLERGGASSSSSRRKRTKKKRRSRRKRR